MSIQRVTIRSTSGKIADTEWAARQDLACAYRLFDHFGWYELIYNHITVRVPDEPEHFLINPFGLLYREVTASNLVKIDVNGDIVGPTAHPVNRAGFIVHSSVHRARNDAHAVAHVHTTAGLAVACQEKGLLPLSFPALCLGNRLAYHDLEGVTVESSERERLAADLGSASSMILRNHGLLTCGPTIAHAFCELYNLQRACEVQIAAQSGGAALTYPPDSVATSMATFYDAMSDDGTSHQLAFDAMKRWMIEKDPSFLY